MSVDIGRLTKILGMTGSVHDGEAIAALRMAQRIMGEAKITWEELLQPKAGGNHQHQQQHSRPQGEKPRQGPHARPGHQETRGELLRRLGSFILKTYPQILSEWERGFLTDWEEKPPYQKMSEKQKAVFERIVLKGKRHHESRKAE